MNEVQLCVRGTTVPGGRARLERDLRRLAALAAAHWGGSVRLSFAVLGDAQIQRLHRESLGQDEPADALAWSLATRPSLWGEIALGADVARREAARRGHLAYHELLLYAVHGVLHLLGHDDHRPEPRRRMRRAERVLLEALGAPAVFGSRRRAAPRGTESTAGKARRSVASRKRRGTHR